MSADNTTEMLMQDDEELLERHEGNGEEPTRAELYEMIKTLQDRVSELESEKDSFDDTPDLKIEYKARQPDRVLDLKANEERAVKVWRDLGEYADGNDRDKLTLNYSQLASAIKDVENLREHEKVNSNTVKRVRDKMAKMSEGIVEVKKLSGKRAKKRYGVVVSVQAWAKMRPDIAVEQQLPPKVAEKLTGE